MKNKIHKNADYKTPCGLPSWRNLYRAIEWDDVTCKNCLKQHKVEEDLEQVFDTAAEQKNSKLLPKLLEAWYDSVTEPGNNLTKNDILVQPPEDDQLPKTPFDKWNDWFHLSCDHSFSPSNEETWDGAIETVCTYLRNELCSVDDLGLSGADKILNKIKKKFKND